MRQAAESDLSRFPRFHSVAAAAEQTGLPDASCAAVTVAQAFHWFEPEAARREFQRILRPGGFVFIIRNQRQIDSSPFARDYEDLLRTLGEPYEFAVHRDHGAGAQSIAAFFPAGSLRFALFDNPHPLDWPSLRGRFLSSSYAPAPGDPRHEDYLAKLEQIFQQHAQEGKVIFDQKTEASYGQLEP